MPAEFEETEIGSAAPDVDHQNMARGGLRTPHSAPRVAAAGLLLKPTVERRLWLLDETHVIGEVGLLRGGERQPLRRSVKGGRNGDRNVLGVECEVGALPRVPGVPCRAKMGEN